MCCGLLSEGAKIGTKDCCSSSSHFLVWTFLTVVTCDYGLFFFLSGVLARLKLELWSLYGKQITGDSLRWGWSNKVLWLVFVVIVVDRIWLNGLALRLARVWVYAAVVFCFLTTEPWLGFSTTVDFGSLLLLYLGKTICCVSLSMAARSFFAALS